MSVHPGSQWIDANLPALRPGLWIAATAQGIVSEATDLGLVYAYLQRRGIPLADVTLFFVPDGILQ
ncbi:hypothetical protein [Denitromonas sp.]|uniref:hypothetical protein n=1 Tax=Denitromonas sp. TaxID=2734609 RepID=UPI002B0003A9|nr:hypothetical protein [Denitromonas sp.]